MIRIAIDASGGDYAPQSVLDAVKPALEAASDTKLILFGPLEHLRQGLTERGIQSDRVELVDAPEQISLHEAPVMAIRRKKESGIVKGMHWLREGRADAFISAGSTGAVLAGGQLIVGRIPGVERPPLGALMPTKTGVTLLVDCGANVDARASWLHQFARMGSLYMRDVVGIPNPRVGLVNIGAEEEKGNALVKETMPLLKADASLNFIGSVEAREIPEGVCDVLVADAFVGNVVLKLYEGVGSVLLSKLKEGFRSSLRASVGAMLARPALKQTMRSFDASAHGGAPLLGLKALVVKVHGNTRGEELVRAVVQCVSFIEGDLTRKIEQSFTIS